MKRVLPFIWIGLLFLVFSCREDDLQYQENSEELAPSYEKKVISFMDMKTKLTLVSGQSTALFSNLSNRGGDDYIQEIDTTYVIEHSNNTLSTYTMRVITKDEDNYSYSNLIIKTINGETAEFIAHYTPTAEWQTAHDNGEYLHYDGILEVTDIYGVSLGEDANAQGRGKVTCTYSVETVYVEGNCEGCPNNVVSSYYILDIECSDGGGGGGTGSGNGGGGPFNENGEGNLPTDPIGGGGGPVTAFDTDFLTSLTQAQINWLNSNPTILSQIHAYLQANGQPHQNGWYENYEAVSFALQWFYDLMNGNNEYILNGSFISFQNSYRGKMSESEIAIFDTLSPQSQYKYLKNAYFASERAKEWYPSSSQHNGKGDAFRHAYFNALNVSSIGEAYAQLLSTAHEEITFNPQNVYQFKEKQMDLHNNQIGRNWGVHYLTFSNISIRELIRNALNNGELRYLKPLGYTTNGGVYQATWANSSSTLTPTNQ